MKCYAMSFSVLYGKGSEIDKLIKLLANTSLDWNSTVAKKGRQDCLSHLCQLFIVYTKPEIDNEVHKKPRNLKLICYVRQFPALNN